MGRNSTRSERGIGGESVAGPSGARRELGFHLAAGGFFGLVTWFFLRPPLAALDRTIAADLGDPLFNLYVLRWGTEHLGNPAAFWNAPFFHPTPDTITLSDHLLGPAVCSWLLQRLGLDGVTAFNLLLLLAFAGAGWSASWVARRAGMGPAGALVTGLCFTFAPFRWDQLAHFQILLTALIPIVLWSFDRALVRRDPAALALFLAAYAIHLGGGLYLTLMIHPVLLVLLLHRWREVAQSSAGQWRRLAVTAFLAAALLTLVAWPYLAADPGFETVRHPSAWRTFAATLGSYWTPPAASHWFGDWTHRWVRPENSLFPGLSTLLLGGGWLLWRRRRSRAEGWTAPPEPELERRWLLRGCLGLAAVGLLAGDLIALAFDDRLHRWLGARVGGALDSHLPPRFMALATALFFGGLLGWLVLRRRFRGSWRRAWPRPARWLPVWDRSLLTIAVVCLALGHAAVYDPLGHFLPGFDRLRVPARFFNFTAFALAFFAGRGADALLARVARVGPRILAVLASLALVLVVGAELRPRQLLWSELPEPEEAAGAYAFLASRDDVEAILELPCWHLTNDTRWMWLQPLHGKPLANGYSGHFPPYYFELTERACWPLPDAAALAQLRTLGVSHLLVHRATAWPKRWMRKQVWAYDPGPELVEVYSSGGTRVFHLRAAPPSAAAGPPAASSRPRPRGG